MSPTLHNPFWQKASSVPPQALTSRQREVAQLIAESHSTQSIAKEMRVSRQVAEHHRRMLAQRLGLDGVNVALVTHWAIKYGLIAL